MSTNTAFSKIYSLSPMQEGMLFHAVMDSKSNAYFEQMSFTIKGALDTELFEKSLNMLIKRHEALRTNFIYQKISKPKQVVFKERVTKINYEDITHLSDGDKPGYIEEFKKKDRNRSFDLTHDILMRMSLFKTGRDFYTVVWSYHHILMDAWCTDIILKEFMGIYKTLREGGALSFGRVHQFSEYISWLEKQDKDKAVEYWKNYLQDYKQQAALPQCRKLFRNGEYRVLETNVMIGGEVTEKLELIARNNNVTLSNVIQTIWGILLQIYNNTNDIVFGAVVSGRPPELTGIEDMIGLFINTIPVRIRCDKSRSFSEVIKTVQKDMLLSEKFSFISLADIQTNSELKHKLIDNILVFENVPVQKGIEEMGEQKGKLFEISDIEVFEQTNYDISISIAPGRELWIMFSYNSLVYDRAVVERIGAHFSRLCEITAGNPNIPIGEISILTEEDKNQILKEFNKNFEENTDDRTFVEMFQKQAGTALYRTAVIYGDREMTYRELNSAANRLGHLLKKKGMGRDVIGAVMLERSPEFLAGIIGIFKAGGAYLPLEHKYPQKRIISMLEDSKAKVLLTRSELIKDMPFTALQGLAAAVPQVAGGCPQISRTPELPGSKPGAPEIGPGAPEVQGDAEHLRPETDRVLNNGKNSALKFLLLDLSSCFPDENSGLPEVIRDSGVMGELPGDPYALNSLEEKYAGRVQVKTAGANTAFNSYRQLKLLIEEYEPDVIAAAAPVYCKDFLHKTVSVLRQWGVKVPVISAGAYAANEYALLLKDGNIDLAVIGEGEAAIAGLAGRMLDNDKKLPGEKILGGIAGLAYIPEKEKCKPGAFAREMLMLDHMDGELSRQPEENPEKTASPEDLAYVIYTSGSTGIPKGAMIEHRGMLNHILAEVEQLHITGDSVIAQNASQCFDISVWQFLAALTAGGKTAIYADDLILEPGRFIKQIIKDGVSILEVVPTYLTLMLGILAENPAEFKALKYIMPTGEAVTANLIKKWLELYPEVKVVNAYGPAEASDDITQYIMDGIPENEIVPIGKPIRNTRIYITDKEMNLCPVGIAGEICVSGTGVGRGYINDTEKTREVFGYDPFIGRPGVRLYKTGDMGRWLPDGNIEFIGRRDHQVKIRGFRIETGEIESKLCTYEGIKQAIVMDITDEGENRYLCAYFTASEREVAVADLRRHLAQSLPDYMIPSRFMQLEEMPVTHNGKIDRKALPEPDKIVSGGEYIQARNEYEMKIEELWQEILSIKRRIGINENFFDLGGHSIKIIALSARIHKVFNVEIPLKDMFDNQTINQQAEFITSGGKKQFISIARAEEKEFYPLSPAENRLFLLNQLDKTSTGYNMPGTLVLEGEVDREHLKEVFNKLIKRHETLRTSFEIVDNEPVQRINKDVEFELEFYQLDTHLLNGESEEICINNIINAFVRPFDLARAPLLRAGLVKLSEGRQLLMYDVHHIVADGISMSILENEFVRLYNGQELLESKLQYRDFCQWQNNMLKTNSIKKQEEYWLEVLSGEIQHLNLPADFQRPFIQSFKGDRVRIRILKEELPNLGKVMSDTRATLYMVLMAAFNVLLYKYTNQEDIIIGSTIAGRPHPDLDNVIGMFVNTLAMRNYPKADKRFYDFLLEVKERSIKAYENQDYQFEELISKLNIKRDLSRNPLLDIVLTLLSGENDGSRFESVKIKPYNYYNRVAQFDLALDAYEGDKYIEFCFEYCTDLFEKRTIERMARHFIKILAATLDNPALTIKEIDMLSTEEKEEILEKSSSLKEDYCYDITLRELFEQQVYRTPEVIALHCGEEQLSYAELNARADQLAAVLREKGINRGDIIGVIAENSLETIVGFLGIVKAGGVYLPIDPKYPRDMIAYLLEDSKAALVLVQIHISDKIDLEIQALILEDLAIKPAGESGIENISTPDDLAYIIYTSGTTGRPKGVMIENRSIVNQLLGLADRFGFDNTLNHMLLSSISFDASIQNIMLPLVTGGRLFIPKSDTALDLSRLKEFIKEYWINVFDGVPMLMEAFIDTFEKEEKLYLKYIILGGDVFPVRLVDKIRKSINCENIINIYGPTETTINASAFEINREELFRESVPIGYPLSNYDMYILDKDKNLVPIGVDGELHIGGAGVARGYLNNLGLTEEKFILNPYRKGQRLYKTGDIARRRSDFGIQFRGRKDYQVKIRGYRIELGEIEECLVNHRLIEEAVVVAVNAGADHIRLCAYVTSESEVDSLEIKAYLGEKIAEYKIPAYIIRIDKMPLTPSGKVDRSRLPDIDDLISLQPAPVAPGNEVEEGLVIIWKKILDIQSIGIHDDFFALGGHSLKAAVMMSTIQKEFNVSIPMVDIFKKPTVHQLAKYIINASKENIDPEDNNLVLLKKSRGSNPNLFMIHDGTGTVEAYIRFCGNMGDEFNIWGIRADRFENYAPKYITIEEVAKKYIGRIKFIQPDGPYNIAGWCIGGTVAFEIARQLEISGNKVAFLGLISSAPPKTGFENVKGEFSIANEVGFFRKILPDGYMKWMPENIQDLNEIWPAVLDYICRSPDAGRITETIKANIPQDISQAIPDYEQSDIKEIAYYFNIIRSFFVARSHYIPPGKINAPVVFFDAEKELVYDKKEWGGYCVNKIDCISVAGDHFSIFKSEDTVKFAEIFYNIICKSHNNL